ncbi:hypothetical protein ZWY2020_058029 [Hordeum vulgare]|nr:hypothetical protein ZWY2020_058029 [Hordeum vulgare]
MEPLRDLQSMGSSDNNPTRPALLHAMAGGRVAAAAGEKRRWRGRRPTEADEDGASHVHTRAEARAAKRREAMTRDDAKIRAEARGHDRRRQSWQGSVRTTARRGCVGGRRPIRSVLSSRPSSSGQHGGPRFAADLARPPLSPVFVASDRFLLDTPIRTAAAAMVSTLSVPTSPSITGPSSLEA